MSHAEEEAERLAIKFAELSAEVDAMCFRAHNLPVTITVRDEVDLFAPVIVDLRDKWNTIERIRKEEKEPHLRKGQAVDGYFEPIRKRLEQTGLTLRAIVDAWAQKVLAEERSQREEARIAAERAAREAEERLAAGARAKAEAEAAAARARLPERQEGHLQKAAEHAAAMTEAAAEVRAAQMAADDARLETLRKSSDLVRTRTDEGRLVTMRQVPHVEILDRNKLDKDALWPFLKEEWLRTVLLAYFKTSGHRAKMDGAVLEMRDTTEIR